MALSARSSSVDSRPCRISRCKLFLQSIDLILPAFRKILRRPASHLHPRGRFRFETANPLIWGVGHGRERPVKGGGDPLSPL